ncbi:Carnitine monooxygenase oxygenase subunit [Fulvia fulva]|uniref:Choline monooxygenase, chloroplastic n=1 Tax=Passalora fulva TaxID=5499 RepID=A0A9Q8PD37_PASFU|nr:Carnitine monooxygenase oxygenase subunit [Fulvia fulva]KAK4620018.1 Carnitine monooxygenase oxygenase subunit [Fulvia fulva]KAK4620548.1 Carnitine monooxygenase oxygenase subunit [Fulvia fulva]UJO20197.1 Carnitine monooxygenase oxygenase subunit [Fulvia fulva]WPV17069.1 Carnitine monooxygenase oxygenase subunit [Fulvia fulva]WPV32388.1 Carnitine monooxygenase oxygenase subunit [Fulvia fulva]
MASLLSWFGGPAASKEQTSNKKTTVRALPAEWYTAPEMYQLERRAIFSRRWLFMTHNSRFKQAGDFIRFNVAGYDFVIIQDRQNNINAFHNVCRHRAYQVVEEPQGRKNILSCRYHGWSYGLNGKLAKAPDYDTLDDFDKNANGLFPIHVHIDQKGFIWVNMDSNETPELSWEEQFAGVDEQERFAKFDFADYKLDHTYELEANYNWKIASDNFNECYHCKTTHPDVPTFLTIDSHDCEGKDGHIQHDQAPTDEQKEKGFDVNSTYYFPHVSMSISPHFMMIQRFMPVGPSKTTVEYEVYRNTNSSDEDFKAIADTYARVMKEDKALCDKAQRNLNAGVFVNGELHPRWEKGPLFFQSSVRDVITEHFKKEKAAGQEIWPARQKVAGASGVSDEDLEICKGIGCGQQKEILAW